MLCTTESLLDGFDINRMGQLFIRWYNDSYWTPWGKTFDVGIATQAGIKRMMRGIPPEEAGGLNENDNGNGSLMRILPVGLYCADSSVAEIFEYAALASSLTHRHPRCQMACCFYCLMAASLMKGLSPLESYNKAIENTLKHCCNIPYSKEQSHFNRLFSGSIGDLPEEKVQSGGYVIHTLEASIWCLLNSHTFAESVLKAVNLGDDTDTTGIVTGGLAGILYGIEAIPEEWISAIARKEDIEKLFNDFINFLASRKIS